MDVVIDGMVVEAEVTMVEACTGLITVGRGEATVVGINMFTVCVESLGYYCLGYACRGNVTTVSCGPEELSQSHYQHPDRDGDPETEQWGVMCGVMTCVLYSLSLAPRGEDWLRLWISETEWSDGSDGPTPATAGRARH